MSFNVEKSTGSRGDPTDTSSKIEITCHIHNMNATYASQVCDTVELLN